ncbi:TIGR03936 family radical SAM-associated protein [Lachnotalea glycerini]|uniref:TIGR03936 family radical SAM-associated protein n=1 Tax=Lachnotalea glycerini TaxID=1763509 RepID=UPI002FE57D31
MYALKIRIKFKKEDSMKFIGHLDIMRYFQKAMRRADIDIAYSEGYSPHQIMSFASPLGVGITSDGEYIDIEIKNRISSKEAMHKLNEVMVEGIEILSFRQLPKDSKNAMSIVEAADYEIKFREGYEPKLWEERLKDFFTQEEITVTKKTKKSEKEVDIKPMIYSLNVSNGKVSMQIASGSANNLKPELVMQAFCEFIDFEPREFALLIHRKELYVNIGDESKKEFLALENLGEELYE